MHLSEMTCYLGPPPKELLQRGRRSCQYFDTEGVRQVVKIFVYIADHKLQESLCKTTQECRIPLLSKIA